MIGRRVPNGLGALHQSHIGDSSHKGQALTLCRVVEGIWLPPLAWLVFFYHSLPATMGDSPLGRRARSLPAGAGTRSQHGGLGWPACHNGLQPFG